MVHVYFQVFNVLEGEGYRSIESFVVLRTGYTRSKDYIVYSSHFHGHQIAPKRNLHFDSSSHCFSSGIQWLIMFCQSKYVSQNEEEFMLNWQQIYTLDFVCFFFL